MRKICLFIILVLLATAIQAQNHLIGFTGTGASTTADLITVENLTQGKSLTLNGFDLLRLQGPDGSPVFNLSRELRIFPNPASSGCRVEYTNSITGKTTIEIDDLAGRVVQKALYILKEGKNTFEISGLSRGLYTLRVYSPGQACFGKLLCTGSSGTGSIVISHLGYSDVEADQPMAKSAGSEVVMQFNKGDLLKFTGLSGAYTTIFMDSPEESKTITFNFIACTDADNNHYPIVQIGSQFWMAENLKTTKYRNGDPISMISDASKWISSTSGAWCNYNNQSDLVPTYGRLYNWYAISDSRNLAPAGWKVPSYDESVVMAKYLSGDKAVGGKLKETGISHWNSPNTGAVNSTGFTGRPGGIRFNDGEFYSMGNYAYWWCPSGYDSLYSYAFGLRHNLDSLKYYIGEKNYGLSVRCIKEAAVEPEFPSIETGTVINVKSVTIPVEGGTIQVSKPNTPVDGLKISVPAHSFPSSQTFNVSYSEIKNHGFGKYFNPVSPLISVSYNGDYANELMTVEVPVNLPEGYFAMGFIYNEETGELEGMPLLGRTQNSITVGTRHFATSSLSGKQQKSRKHGETIYQELTKTGYFVISAIKLDELRKQGDIVSGFEPGADDWEFVNQGSHVSPPGICAGMSLTAMWYYLEERLNDNTQLFHKYDKTTIANYNKLWQDNPLGIKFASMAQYDYLTSFRQDTAYHNSIYYLSKDKTKDSLSWYALAYSILQTKQPQLIQIWSESGGGHAIVANEVWMKDGKLWISDPNHPGDRNFYIHYTNQEFEPYYSSLDITSETKAFEYIAYSAKSAITDWRMLRQRWQEVNDSTIGKGVFPEKKLWVIDPTWETDGWELSDGFRTNLDTLTLFVKDNSNDDFSFAVFDAEGYQVVPVDQKYDKTFRDDLILKPGLNIIGYCLYSKSKNKKGEEVWDWADFKWVDVYYDILEIKPNPIISGWLNKEVTLTASTMGTAPYDARYIWNFGDGTPEIVVDNDSIVKHTYTQVGDFEVKLTLINNLSGKKTVEAKAEAKIGFKGFNYRLEGIYISSQCKNNNGEIVNSPYCCYGYLDEFYYSFINPKPVLSQNGNTITASWDGSYTFEDWLTTYTYPSKGTATFTLESNNTLKYSFSEGDPGSNYFSISGILPATGEYAYGRRGDYDFGAQNKEIQSIVKRFIDDNGNTCEANSFRINYNPGQVLPDLILGFSFLTK